MTDAAFLEQAKGIMARAAVPVDVEVIPAGKLRRYHGVPMYKQLLDFETMGKNTVDIFKIVAGLSASLRLVKKFQPDVVFAKGGFVSLPVGYAAKLCRVPLVIHDSDTKPGLTNRFLARFARRIATGSPLENYPYNKTVSHYTGVPVGAEFHAYDSVERQAFRARFGVTPDETFVVVTGGGLGAQSINRAIARDVRDLTDEKIRVYHICGKNNYNELAHMNADNPRYSLVPFVYEGMAELLASADVVVARGSATFLQELAALGKAVILIPAKHLADQVKNAHMYASAQAAVVLGDDLVAEPHALTTRIRELVTDTPRRKQLVEQLRAFAKPNAARDTAKLIMDVAA